MDHKLAESIVEAAKDEGYEAELRTGYSGRGMYGRTTCAIVTDDVKTLLVGAVRVAFDAGTRDDGDDELDVIVGDLGDVKQDSMGRGIVFY